MPASTPPTLDQLLNLVARAERKGGLTFNEGTRLRAGLRHLSDQHPTGLPSEDDVTTAARLAELRTKYVTTRQLLWKWKRRALDAEARTTSTPVDHEARAEGSRPQSSPPSPTRTPMTDPTEQP
ncbi:hypothetical protein [Streptomyces griseosporeus]|uniref:hypothetical protein n=1 Tax=Streptomyces griseosporeus TaxID=1910 RepID=UPI00379C3E34